MAYTGKTSSIPSYIIQYALDSIAVTGNYNAALNILKITSGAFTQWRDRDPELSAKVDAAKREYYETSDYTRARIARRYATAALKGEEKVRRMESRDLLAEDGNIVGEIRTVIDVEPPRYLVEGHLFNRDQDYTAIRQLALSGHLSPDTLEAISDAVALFEQGLTQILTGGAEEEGRTVDISKEDVRDATAEAIRGLMEQNAVAVPSELAKGQGAD